MYGAGLNDPMPSDKLMKLFIIQSISSFVAGDHESGLHYLNEVKQTYAQHMMTLNPTLKTLAKEIIQSLDMFTPGTNAGGMSNLNATEQPVTQEQINNPAEHPVDVESNDQPSSVTSELQNLLNRRRARRGKKN